MTRREYPSFVTHLECSMTGARYPAGRPHGLSEVGRPLLVRYDLAALARGVDRDQVAARGGGFWKYREFLPVTRSENVVALGETETPLIAAPRAAAADGADPGALVVKDEGRLPTGSFKARGLALAVAMARELGLGHLAMPTNGNAGAAMAAYASRAGLRATVFCPDDTPEINISEIELQGAAVYRVNGLINDCGRIVRGRPRDHRLVRRFDPQGALPDRGQEDHGPGTGRTVRLEPSRRHLLSDRRREPG